MTCAEGTVPGDLGGLRRRWVHQLWPRLALLAVLGIGLALRLYGIAWDDGYLFHPDERKIFMVADDIHLPEPLTWNSLLSPDSPLNPRFFAYGSFPIYLLKLAAYVAGELQSESPSIHSLYLVGRPLSALFDIGTVALVFSLGRKLYGWKVGLLSAALVSSAVLHVQLSHFYAVDTILTFFVVLSVYIAVTSERALVGGVALGMSIGLALATKVSASPLFLVALVAWGYWARANGASESSDPKPDDSVRSGEGHTERVAATMDRTTARRGWLRALPSWLVRFVGGFLVTVLASILVFVLAAPYAVLDLWNFFADAFTQAGMASGTIDVPYTRQFWGRPNYLYEARQLVVWSLGIPLGLAAGAGTLWVILRACWQRRRDDILLLCWPVAYLAITGSALAKFLRYMLPVIPFLCLFAGRLMCVLVRRARPGWSRSLARASLVAVLATTGLYALSYMNVYAQTHPWIETTQWICESIPQGKVLTSEHWDDPLPLTQADGALDCWDRYGHIRMAMFDPDDETKLQWLIDTVLSADYVVLSTSRLYGTIPRLGDRYPVASQYYQALFNGELGFELEKHGAVYPRLGPVTIRNNTFNDADLLRPSPLSESKPSPIVLDFGYADESFVVYDHPMPMVFRKVRALSRQELQALFAEAAHKASAP